MHLHIPIVVCSLFSITPTWSSAIPQNITDPSGFTVHFKASDYFPHSKVDLSPFDIDVYFCNFDPDTKSWLMALDPETGTTDEAKARILTEISYAKRFDENDSDMVEDVQNLLAAVAGNLTRATAMPPATPPSYTYGTFKFVVDSRHAVKWAGCTPFYQCVTGTLCPFSLNPSRSPRSHCEHHGGSLCCISWSNYDVKFWFFERTWLACDAEIRARDLAKASCEGYGETYAGGNVCLSNRARHC